MPQMISKLSPSRLRLRVLRVLMAEPDTYNRKTLAEKLDERYDRVADAVTDIEAEFGLTYDSRNQHLTVILPADAVVL